jgi:Mor family transcriptional regulator
MKSGQSTFGYGKSKELVMQAHTKGMSMPEIAKACGLSYASVYSVVRRMELDFKPANNRKKNGFVKTIVLSEHENGLTPVEIRTKHNLIKNSVYAVYYYCGIIPNKKTK